MAWGKLSQVVAKLTPQQVKNGNSYLWRILQYALIPVLLLMGGAIGSNALALAAIKANRFTSADGLEVWKAVGEVREKMASLPTVAQPTWLLQRLDRLENKVDKLTAELQTHAKDH